MSLDVSLYRVQETEVYTDNITHNLGPMAKAAGVYYALWRPEELYDLQADALIDTLERGYNELVLYPHVYKKFNPANGWGSYEDLVKFIHRYREACIKYPDARIEVSR